MVWKSELKKKYLYYIMNKTINKSRIDKHRTTRKKSKIKELSIEFITYPEDEEPDAKRERYKASLRDELNDEVGYFEIDIIPPRELSIGIDDYYQKKGYAKKLINNLCKYLLNNNKLIPRDKLYIDGDASNGFWEKIGMTYTPSNDKEGEGLEKVITFEDLCAYANVNIKSKTSRGKIKKTKKRRQTKRRRPTKRKRPTKKRRAGKSSRTR